GRSCAQGRDHHDCIVENPEFNPDAVKVAVQVFIGALPVAGRDVGRMRIELRQHILERFFNQVTRVHLVYVRLLNVGKYFPEFPDLRVDIRILSFPECGAHEYPRRQTCKEDERKPDLTLCIRNLHTRIMSYYLRINEIARKFILRGTAMRQRSKIVDAIVEKDKKSDRIHLAMINRINFKAIAYLYPLQYGKIGLKAKEHQRIGRPKLRTWLRTVLPGRPIL